MGKKPTGDNYIDISSKSQVNRLYNRKKRFSKKTSIIAIILSFILLFTGGGMVYLYNVLNSLVHVPNEDNNNPVQSSTTGTGDLNISSGISNSDLLTDTKVLNVMLFGQDSASGGTEKYGRSDTMILASIDNRNKKIKLTSFLRDTFVSIPGYYDAKINASYAQGGAPLAIKTVEANFGIKIDRYAIVDFKSFKSIIDILGGIELDLSQDEIDYINYQIYINNQADTNTEITASPGKVKLNGKQALWYARNRGFEEKGHSFVVAGDDHDRTARQRNLINTIISNMKSASLPQIVQIVGDVGPLVTTNFKKSEIMFLVSNSLQYLKYDIKEMSVTPRDKLGQTWRYPDPWESNYGAIEITDWNATRKNIAKFIYEDLIESNTSGTE